MSSENSFWVSIQKNVGHAGHFSRIENAVDPGFPDVSYCIKGIEGMIELKHRHAAPRKADTPVFLNKGLRDAQVVWLYRRTQLHRGRAYILSQVEGHAYLLRGTYCREFNLMTLEEIVKAAIWRALPRRPDWAGLLTAITARW